MASDKPDSNKLPPALSAASAEGLAEAPASQESAGNTPPGLPADSPGNLAGDAKPALSDLADVKVADKEQEYVSKAKEDSLKDAAKKKDLPGESEDVLSGSGKRMLSSPSGEIAEAPAPSSGKIPPSVRWLQLQQQWRQTQLDSFERRQQIDSRLQRFRIHVKAAQAVTRFRNGLEVAQQREAAAVAAGGEAPAEGSTEDPAAGTPAALAAEPGLADGGLPVAAAAPAGEPDGPGEIAERSLPPAAPLSLVLPTAAAAAVVPKPINGETDTGTPYGISLESLVELNTDRKLEDLQAWGGTANLAKLLRVEPLQGLVDNEEEIEKRRDVFGTNTYPEKKQKPFWRFMWDASKDAVLRILIVCAIVNTAASMISHGAAEGWYDGIGIIIAVILVILIVSINDWNQARQFRVLNRKKKNIPIEVTRGSRRMEISIYDTVVGDVVHLNLGDQIPADGLVLKAITLVCDESSMTGESRPVEKTEAGKPFLISGTKVVEGYGDMLVTAVGLNTEWGRIMSTISEDDHEQTPLQRRLAAVALGIGKIGLLIAILVFLILTIRYLAFGLDYSTFVASDLINILMFFTQALTIVVVAIPEGLPLAVTLALAFSLRKMIKDNALVRHLKACEIMGGATTICSDKTGTLTTNKMVVTNSWVAGVQSEGTPDKSQFTTGVLQALLEAICTNTNGTVYRSETGEVEITGKPTETAVLGFGVDLGAEFQEELDKATIIKVEPFNSARKRMGVLVQRPNGVYRVHWKGASEVLLAECTRFLDSNGQEVSMTVEKRAELNALIDNFAEHSLRALCIAYRDFNTDPSLKPPVTAPDTSATANGELAEEDEETKLPRGELVALCIVGIKDPCRPGVPEAVRICQDAGVIVRMVTGDYIKTAMAIARECNILSEGGLAMEGPEFRQLPHEEALRVVKKLQVLARSSPSDKQKLVKLLREQGHVVAVTGDGTNDAPALHSADVGLSMGISGTEIAKESSDIIIMDDNFSTVVPVIRWGRSVFENIRKFLQFQLIVNIVALSLNFATACVYGVVTLTVFQLLWVNIIMDSLGALALATDPPQEKYMKRKPYGRYEPLINNIMWRNMLLGAVWQLIILFTLQFAGYQIFGLQPPPSEINGVKLEAVNWPTDWQPTRVLYTIIFNTFVFLQIFNEITARDMESINVFRGFFKNYYFMSVLAFTVGFQIIIVQLLNKLATTTKLSWMQWLWCVLLGSTSIPMGALIKLIKVRAEPNMADWVCGKVPPLRWLFMSKTAKQVLEEADEEAAAAEAAAQGGQGQANANATSTLSGAVQAAPADGPSQVVIVDGSTVPPAQASAR